MPLDAFKTTPWLLIGEHCQQTLIYKFFVYVCVYVSRPHNGCYMWTLSTNFNLYVFLCMCVYVSRPHNGCYRWTLSTNFNLQVCCVCVCMFQDHTIVAYRWTLSTLIYKFFVLCVYVSRLHNGCYRWSLLCMFLCMCIVSRTPWLLISGPLMYIFFCYLCVCLQDHTMVAYRWTFSTNFNAYEVL